MADDPISTPVASDANYQEVFEVVVNTSSFEEGLQQLSELYNKWVSSLGDDAQGVIGAGTVAGLKDIDTAVKSIAEDIRATFTELSNTLSSTFDTTTSAIQSKIDEVTTLLSNAGKEQTDQLKEQAEQRKAIATQEAQQIVEINKDKDTQLAHVREEESKARYKRTNPRDTATQDVQAGLAKGAVLSIDQAAQKGHDKFQDYLEKLSVVESTPSISANLESRRTPQQENARDINAGIQGTLEASYTKELEQISKLEAEEERLRIKSVEGLTEQSQLVTELTTKFRALGEQLATMPKPGLEFQFQPGAAVDENELRIAREFSSALAEHVNTGKQLNAVTTSRDSLAGQLNAAQQKVSDAARRNQAANEPQVPKDASSEVFKERIDALTKRKQDADEAYRNALDVVTKPGLSDSELFKSTDQFLSAEKEQELSVKALTNATNDYSKALEREQAQQDKVQQAHGKSEERVRSAQDVVERFNSTPRKGQTSSDLQVLVDRLSRVKDEATNEVQRAGQHANTPGISQEDSIAANNARADAIRKEAESEKLLQRARDAQSAAADRETASNERLASSQDRANRTEQESDRVRNRPRRGDDTAELDTKITELSRLKLSADEAVARAYDVATKPNQTTEQAAKSAEQLVFILRDQTKAELDLARAQDARTAATERESRLNTQVAAAQAKASGLDSKISSAETPTSITSDSELKALAEQAANAKAALESVRNVQIGPDATAQERLSQLNAENEAAQKYLQTLTLLNKEQSAHDAAKDKQDRLNSQRDQLESKRGDLQFKADTATASPDDLLVKQQQRAQELRQELVKVEEELNRLNSIPRAGEASREEVTNNQRINELLTQQASKREQLKELEDAAAHAPLDNRVAELIRAYDELRLSLAQVKRAASEVNSDRARDSVGEATVKLGEMKEAIDQAKVSAQNLDSATLATAESLAKAAGESTNLSIQTAKARTEASAPVRLFGNLASDIEGLITGVIRFQIAWKAVGLILEGIGKVVSAPFDAIKNGLEYLDQLEARTIRVGEAINATTHFSSDLTEQLKRSSEAGGDVVKVLENFSVKRGLKPEDLTNTFVALKNNGAGQLTGSLGETVQLAEQLGITLKQARGEVELTRTIQSQIPKLLQGQVSQYNIVLQTLGVTNEKWNSMVARARIHHDLVQQLAPYVQKYSQYLQGVETNYDEVKGTLELIIKEIEAVAAKPIFEEWKRVLVEILGWITQHRDVLEKIMGLLGSTVKLWLQVGESIIGVVAAIAGVKNNTQGWVELLTGALQLVGTIAITLQNLFSQTAALIQLAQKTVVKPAVAGEDYLNNKVENATRWVIGKFLTNDDEDKKANRPGSTSVAEKQPKFSPAQSGALDTFTKSMAASDARAAQQQQALQSAVASIKASFQTGSKGDNSIAQIESALNKIHGDTGNLPEQKATGGAGLAKAEYAQAKDEYELEADRVKKQAEEARAAIEEQARLGVVSYKTAAQQIGNVNKEELRQLDQLAAALMSKAVAARIELEKTKFKTPQDQQKALKSFDDGTLKIAKQIADNRDAVVKTGRSADNKRDEEAHKIAEDKAATEIRLARDAAREKEALTQEQARQERISAVQAVDAKVAALNEQHRIDEQEFANQTRGLANDAAQYQKYLDDKLVRDKEYGSKVEELTQERVRAVHEMHKQQVQAGDNLRGAEIGTEEQAHSLRGAVSVDQTFGDDDQALIDLKRNEIDTLMREREAELAVAEAKRQDSEESRKLRVEIEGLRKAKLAAIQDEVQQRTQGVSNPVVKNAITKQVLNERIDETAGQIGKDKAEIGEMNKAYGSRDQMPPDEQKAYDELNKNLDGLNELLKQLLEAKGSATADKGSFFDNALKDLGLDGVFREVTAKKTIKRDKDGNEVLDKDGNPEYDHTTLDKVESVASSIPTIVGDIKQEKSIYDQGTQKGGVAGGIGSLLSTGPLSEALSSIPIVGAFVKPVGELISFIGDAFHAGAIKIAQQIKTQFDNTEKSIQSGQLGPAAGIQAISNEQEQAITRLSGKKGGQAQLQALLPQMTEALEQLVVLQQQTLVAFDNQLRDMQLQSDTLGQINQEWTSVNQQVAQYINAGGDAAKATQMLQLAISQIERQSGAELTQGYDQAVKDSIQLNNLALQRYNLTKSFLQQQFALVNGDSIEQMQAGAITRGQQLDQLRSQYQQQLDDLNSQISVESKKVSAESQIFDLAKSISDLHRQDEALTLASLNLQLNKYKDLMNASSAIQGGSAVPGAGNAGLTQQLEQIDNYINAVATGLNENISRKKPANALGYQEQLTQLNAQRQQIEQQLSKSAGGSIVATGAEGSDMQTIQNTLAALTAQLTFAEGHNGPWQSNLAAYIANLQSQITQLTQESSQMMNTAPTIGVNPGVYDTSQLNMTGLQSTLNYGLGVNQNNTITIAVNVPPGTDTASIGKSISDSLSSELARQSRQGITGG